MKGHEQGQRTKEGHAASKSLLLSFSLLFPLVLLMLSLILGSQGALGSDNLLSNGGFEGGTTGWTKSPGDVIFATVADPVHLGEWAASLNRKHVPGEMWIYQNVNVVAGTTYTLTGWAYNNESSFLQVCLRIKWLNSQYPDVASSCLDGLAGYYRPITLSAVTAPPDAATARIMALAEIADPSPANPVYFDDLSLTSNIPSTPTRIPCYVPLVVKEYP